MKSNELMIGDEVQFNSQLRGWILDTVHAEYFKSEELENVKGIPLTSKWLINMGFVWLDEREAFRFKEETHWLEIYMDDGKYLFSKDNMSCVQFYFVHNVQQFIFVLTGEKIIL